MSTRACIHITKTDYYNPGNPNNGKKEAQWYHHSDGYPTGLGVELTMILLQGLSDNKMGRCDTFGGVEYFFRDTFTHAYDKESVGEWHGDLEYVYHINFDDGITLTCHKMERNVEGGNDHENWRNWKSQMLLNVPLRKMGEKSYYCIESVNIRESF